MVGISSGTSVGVTTGGISGRSSCLIEYIPYAVTAIMIHAITAIIILFFIPTLLSFIKGQYSIFNVLS